MLKRTTEKLPNLFAYNDFRMFLADYQKSRFENEPSFSKSTFSKLLGLPNTRSYLVDVLKGKKVTPEFVERFISVLEFDKHEANYFRMLVKHNQCENPDERALYFQQLITLNRTPRRILETKVFEYYRNWYHSVIRALLSFFDFSDDYSNLASRLTPSITVKQAKESIKLLTSLNLISRDKDGFFRPTDKAISTPDFVRDELVKQYQMQVFELAKGSVVNCKPSEAGQYITNTISISEQNFKVLGGLVEKFRSEIRALAVKDEYPADRVYNICLALIPVSKKENK
jgi:uncharacterized protein (TIGR02147 family)